jgi:catechol 2,3-dioxygenase-like lactoylglutathione lyase family enzyme
MITSLDHVLLVCPSIDDGEALYTALLGREPDWRAQDPGGAATCIFQLENTALEIMAPSGGGPLARRLHAILDADGPGLKSLIFASADVGAAKAVLDRRGLKPDDITVGESLDPYSGKSRSWYRFRLDETQTSGVRIFVLERKPNDPLAYKPAGPGAAHAMDHVVVNTPNPDRACALYGARLGLRLALDRSNTDWDSRLMFFRTGEVTVELVHRLSKGIGQQPDRLFGLTWRVMDIEAAHARMTQAGFSVSEIRAGRRAATRVFTVREGTLGVPTLILSQDGASEAA